MENLTVKEVGATEITYEIDQWHAQKCFITFKQGKNQALFLGYKYGNGSYSLDSFMMGNVGACDFTKYDSRLDTLRFRGRGRGRKSEANIEAMTQFIRDCLAVTDTLVGGATVEDEEHLDGDGLEIDNDNKTWGNFLEARGICYEDRNTGNRPCDDGAACDYCNADYIQEDYKRWKGAK